jgi:hypothetical protein
MTRRHLRRFALLSLLGLLLAQFALAAYACQWTGVTGTGKSVQLEMPTGCDHMDPATAADNGLLCMQHCKAESGTIDSGSVTPQVGAAMALLPYVLWIARESVAQAPPDPELGAARRPVLGALHARLRI